MSSSNESRGWLTLPTLWKGLKPVARRMRNLPTQAEDALWQRLRNRRLNGSKFRRQHVIDRYIVDFYCAEADLVIELDGPVHLQTVSDDGNRQEVLENLGLQVLRFTNDEVVSSIENVLRKIEKVVLCKSGTG